GGTQPPRPPAPVLTPRASTPEPPTGSAARGEKDVEPMVPPAGGVAGEPQPAVGPVFHPDHRHLRRPERPARGDPVLRLDLGDVAGGGDRGGGDAGGAAGFHAGGGAAGEDEGPGQGAEEPPPAAGAGTGAGPPA